MPLYPSRLFGLDMTRKVCLVTNELYPFYKGGIARLMYNFTRENARLEDPVDIHLLLPPDFPATREEINTQYGDLATVHFAPATPSGFREVEFQIDGEIEHWFGKEW